MHEWDLVTFCFHDEPQSPRVHLQHVSPTPKRLRTLAKTEQYFPSWDQCPPDFSSVTANQRDVQDHQFSAKLSQVLAQIEQRIGATGACQ